MPPQSPSGHLTDKREGGEQTFQGCCCLSPGKFKVLGGCCTSLASNPSCRLAGGRHEPGHLYRKREEAWLQSGSEGRELTQPRTPQGQRTVTGKRPQLNMALSHKGDTDLQQIHLSH